MKRVCLALLLIAAPAAAQSARVRVRAGDVTGMEMNLEGALGAPRGGTLRWLVTAYEVTGLSDLRPAVDATVHLTTSLEQTEDAATLRTDAHGRVLVELPIPADTDEESFRAVLRIVSSGGVQRRFELTVNVLPGDAIDVHLARPRVDPRGSMRAFGRAYDRRSGRPRANAEVRLTLRDAQGRPVMAPADVRTDAAGLFAHTFRLPREVRGSVAIEARTGDEEHPVYARAQADVNEITAEPMLVAVAPERRIVRPGERIRLEVAVRTPNGRPIEGATVTLDGADVRDTDRRVRTDARGRALLAWTVPNIASGVSDFSPGVTAAREGFGSARGHAQVRAVADEHAAALSIEGGALSPELGGRIYVRVVGADGRPAGTGIPVRIEGPRLPPAGVSGMTDDDGVAALDVVPSRSADATNDRCGGQSATAIEVRVGAGPRFAVLSPCLPLDPDAAARVRVARPLVTAGSSVEITVDRVAAAARAPVELTIMARDPNAAVAAMILPAGEQRATIALPADTGGLLWVRARPLIGNTREIVRGGTAAFFVRPGAPLRVTAGLERNGTVSAHFDGPSDEAPHAYVVATPIDEAIFLARTLRDQTLGPFGELRRDPAGAHDALLFGALAAHTPADVAAPSVLRAGRVVPVPAPADPTSAGLLRDPWRARSRFVTGRLALIFHALEQYVASALPERIDDVAVRGARGFTFNGQILESVAASGSLGPAGATGLGGEPLTIEQLQRFDASLTYDNVARRITRERLFRLVLALRNFVQGRGFDLPWSRLGDPSTWIRQLENQYVNGVGTIERRMLADGWGRPFRLVPARGGRSRFSFVDPLGAWELVSSGPDGRFGTGDDVWDPTQRILRSGSAYAEAVGEDVLVARLEGVELGRASLELLPGAEPAAANVGNVPYESGEPARQLAQAMWTQLPSVLEPDPDPLALRRPAHAGDGAGGTLTALPREGGTVSLTLDEEPRTWGAVIYAWTPSGWGTVDTASSIGGAPLLVEGEVPARLHAGETVTLDLALTNLSEESTALRLSTAAEGLEVRAPARLEIGPGEAVDFAIELVPARDPGAGFVELTLSNMDGAAVRTMRWRTRRDSGLHPLRLRSAGLVRDRALVTSLAIPQDARRAAGRVIVVAPSALASDPDLADLRRNDPALVAWSNALAGRRSDDALWSRLLLAQESYGPVRGDRVPLSSACAAVAWATADEHDVEARAALQRVREALAQNAPGEVRDPDPDSIRDGAAMLAALGGGAPSSASQEQRELDPLIPIMATLRRNLRRTLRSYPGEPTLLARASAALLIADPRDAYGLAMLDRASEHLTDAPDGGALVRPSTEPADPLDALSATLALALAAHQADRHELAARLLRGGLGRDHVALRRGGEAAFWMLAAGAYGALGQDPERVAVFVDGRRTELALEGGRGVLPITPRPGNTHEVRIEAPEGRGAFARIETALERPFTARTDGPLRLELRGDAGDSAGVAALELTVHAEREVSAPIVDIELPAGVEIDETTLSAIQSASGVASVERREPGFLRVALSSARAATNVVIPLPLRWRVRGDLRGLGAIAYPLGRPEEMTVLAPRALSIRPPQDAAE